MSESDKEAQRDAEAAVIEAAREWLYTDDRGHLGLANALAAYDKATS